MTNKRIFITFPIIMAVSLACKIFIGGPEYPESRIPISTEAVTSLHEEITAAVLAGAVNGEVAIFMNETQLTSFLAFKLSDDPAPIFTDPQVYLKNDQILIYGKTQQGYFSANVGLTLTIGQDLDGNPEIQLTSADFGPFPLPEGLNKAITAIIKEAYMGSIGPVATGFRITSITIADGMMTIIGKIR